MNLFFIPVLRVKTGEPFLMCEQCERSVHEIGQEYEEYLKKMDGWCAHCGRFLRPGFKYCPHCGRKT